MKRIFLAITAGAVGLATFAPSAFAHGGQFRGPVGGLPNGPREPSDPTPPPPPDPSTPTPPTTPSDPSTPTPPSAPTTPTTPSAPQPTTGEMPGPGGKKSQVSLDQWQFWWGYNNDEILGIKNSIYSIKRTAQGVISDVGGAGGARGDSTRATSKQVHDVLIPALLQIIKDPDHKMKPGPDTESAAYIALAKVTDDPSNIPLFMDAVMKDGKKNTAVHQTVNESAAFALGLLRRGDKARQFDAKELDRVRDFLFEVYENDGLQMRTRGFAMIALGLLADQPTTRSRKEAPGGGGLFYAPDPIAMGQVTADRIVDLLKRPYKDSQMYVVALLALGMQQPTDVTPDVINMLKECALKGKLFKEPVDDLISSYAALAIGKLGGESEIGSMVNALSVTQTGVNTKRSAAIALGLLGRRIDGPSRGALAAQIIGALEKVKAEATTKNFAIMSLAYLLQADAEAQHTDVLNAKGAKIADFILKIAEDGKYSERPYGALALGIIGRAIGEKPSIVEYGQFRLSAITVLRKGLTETKMDKRARGAFAIALGILQDEGAKPELVAIVGDKQEEKELRGYSAVALGLIGIPAPDVLKVIKDALKERSSEELRQQTAIALGLLQSPDTIPTLINEIKEADSQNVLGQVVLALAKIGDSRAIQPLVDILQDTSRPDLTRALACAGLGLIGDLEMVPSLARLSKDINYRASPDTVNEALSIL